MGKIFPQNRAASLICVSKYFHPENYYCQTSSTVSSQLRAVIRAGVVAETCNPGS
jgi:hypothetical protein